MQVVKRARGTGPLVMQLAGGALRPANLVRKITAGALCTARVRRHPFPLEYYSMPEAGWWISLIKVSGMNGA